ncbi:MAG: AI-2E family transporter [Anaerolineae bacterium]|nr:AI-2E family transporter [Anaerolineae bacterium]
MSNATPAAPQPRSNNTNWVFVVAIVAVLMVALWTIRSILLLTFASIVLVILFTIPMDWFSRIRIPLGGRVLKINRTVSLILTLVLAVVVVIAIALPLLALLISQFGTLFNTTLPTGIERVLDWWDNGRVLNTLPFLETVDFTPILGQTTTPTSVLGTGRLGIFSVPSWWPDPETARNIVLVFDPARQLSIDTNTLQQIASQVLTALGTVSGSVIPILGGAANLMLNVLIVLFISLYFLAEPQRYIDRVVLYTPVGYRKRMREILRRMGDAIRAWLRVTGVSMLVAGLLTGGLLALIGIEPWAALGTLAGLGSFVPNFGTLIALIPALLVGAVQAPDRLLLIIIIVYGVSFVQSQLISPILANADMKMPPMLILVGQIVFGIFFGFLGIMFAVPITAILLVLLDEVYVKDVLGDTKSVPDEHVYEGIPPVVKT